MEKKSSRFAATIEKTLEAPAKDEEESDDGHLRFKQIFDFVH